MNLRLSLLAIVISAVTASCNFVIAETPNTYVHVTILEEGDTASITISGESQLEIVSTIAESMQALEFGSVVTVNSPSKPFAKPTERDQEEQEHKTSLIFYCEFPDDKPQAYIAVTPMFPFCLLKGIAKRLKEQQITNIKYLNYDDFEVDNIEKVKESFLLSKKKKSATHHAHLSRELLEEIPFAILPDAATKHTPTESVPSPIIGN